MRVNEVELDTARHTLREFRIFRDVHNMALVEAYSSDKTGNTTTHDAGGSLCRQGFEGNTRKDKGKKAHKSPKEKGDKW
ncbi:hypothetical protein PIB30_030824 [Stylosanthes scabra]|uniref:Uncharacterized protein n=1 Tax=Stylosanthes scabra TaxID=79078 RepID=A0ABU6SBA9_9FABA|nr:hypothetical protein [Stylosanthes scabra]